MDTKGQIDKNALEAAEAAVEAREEESLTDLAPDGALMIGGMPARALSMADFRIVQRVAMGLDKASIPMTDIDVALLIIYCLVQVDMEDIAQLWRDANDAERLWARINIEWLSGFGLGATTRMVEDAAPMLQEFRDTMAVVESAGGDGSGESQAATG
ncbi:hypothetical protein PDESU_03309 [Pontiella desulfatans]|uniref:Uncharacterized protein n=1 Tax=Pontiella desulfatans TaxID=2750659 RepID=A0A6C2U449_PONDE|nr:hypothetical protein [Pontiella desulfatans]VGO14740.1 hypothetical protein PDESU_03309 [Pontiella desulfatans]